MLLMGCTAKEEDSSKISYDYDKNNILGLTQITQTEKELVLVFDVNIAKKEECLSAIFDTIWDQPSFYGPGLFGKDGIVEVISSNAYKKKGKMYVEIQCENADEISSVAIKDVRIRNFEQPELEIEIQGGEVISYSRQNFNPDTDSWMESEYEDVYFPLEEGN